MRIVFRVSADPSDNIEDMLDGMKLDEDVDCSITHSGEEIRFDFEIDADKLPVHTLPAARSTAAAYLSQGFAMANWAWANRHYDEEPECADPSHGHRIPQAA